MSTGPSFPSGSVQTIFSDKATGQWDTLGAVPHQRWYLTTLRWSQTECWNVIVAICIYQLYMATVESAKSAHLEKSKYCKRFCALKDVEDFVCKWYPSLEEVVSPNPHYILQCFAQRCSDMKCAYTVPGHRCDLAMPLPQNNAIAIVWKKSLSGDEISVQVYVQWLNIESTQNSHVRRSPGKNLWGVKSLNFH